MVTHNPPSFLRVAVALEGGLDTCQILLHELYRATHAFEHTEQRFYLGCSRRSSYATVACINVLGMRLLFRFDPRSSTSERVIPCTTCVAQAP